MHKVTTSVHQLPQPTISGTRQRPIATSTGRQRALPPHQLTTSEEQPRLIETVMAIQSAHPRRPLTISETPQPLIVTDMAIRREQIDQVLITMAIPILVIPIPTATREAHHPPQLTTSATPRLHIATETDTLKVLLHLPQIILAIATHNSAATTPTQPSGLGNDTSLHTTNPESSSAFYFRGSIVHESTHVVV